MIRRFYCQKLIKNFVIVKQKWQCVNTSKNDVFNDNRLVRFYTFFWVGENRTLTRVEMV